MIANVTNIDPNRVSPAEVVQELSANLSEIDQVYVVAFKDGMPMVCCSGDLAGGAYAASILNSFVIDKAKGNA